MHLWVGRMTYTDCSLQLNLLCKSEDDPTEGKVILKMHHGRNMNMVATAAILLATTASI